MIFNLTITIKGVILVYLQTMANILDDIQFNNHNKRCLKLTSAQYKMMYYVLQFTAINLIVTLKEKSEEWVLSGGSQHNTLDCTNYFNFNS